MSTFADILKKRAAEVERPEPVPVGSYVFVVNGLPKMENVGTEQSKVVNFATNLVQPLDDVDPEAFKNFTQKFGSLPKPQRLSFFIEQKDGTPNLWPIKRFLTETLGIEEGDKSIEQMINESPGKQGAVQITHKPSATGDAVYAQTGQTFAL